MSTTITRSLRLSGFIIGTALLSAVAFNRVHAQETGSESTSVGGYGEVHYTEPEGPTKGQLDLARFVIFLEHGFSSGISVFSELEIEHTRIEAGQSEGGEVAVEQVYMQYNLSEHFGIRAGLVLLPLGGLNEFHEPPTFNGVDRPHFDTDIIPTTAREIGAGVVGTIPAVEGLQYRAYLTSGMHADGFSSDHGILEGRFEGTLAPATSLAFSGRLEYLNLGLKAGLWGYYGGSAAGNTAIADGLFGAPVSMFGADAQYNVANIYLRGEVATGSIGDADKINAAYHTGIDAPEPIGSAFGGGYIEVAYDVAKLIAPTTQQQLLPFVRFEKYNTQSSMPAGFEANKANDRSFLIAGLTFKPVYNVAFKMDWTSANDATDNKLPGQFALGIGYNF